MDAAVAQPHDLVLPSRRSCPRTTVVPPQAHAHSQRAWPLFPSFITGSDIETTVSIPDLNPTMLMSAMVTR